MPSIALPVSLRGQLLSGSRFSPLSLFTTSEPGFWYDPSDLTTMFQDTAGATPVTTPGQTVALALDKSKNGVGTNGSARRNFYTFTEQFENAAWQKLNSTVTANTAIAPDGTTTADTATATTADPGLQQSVSTTSITLTLSIYLQGIGSSNGKRPTLFLIRDAFVETLASPALPVLTSGWQRYTFTGTFSVSPTSVRARVDFVDDSPAIGDAVYVWGAQLETGSTATAYQRITADWASTIPGNHATQATAASRPTYGIVPLGGRRNIYTFTEQFDNADWSKTNTTIAANVEVAPNGTTTADKLQENAGAAVYFSVGRNPSGTFSTAYTWSCYAKAAERTFLSVNFSVAGVNASINLTTGATQLNLGTATLQSVSVGSGWWRFSVAFSTAASGANPLFHIITTDTAIGVPTVVGTAGFGLYLWGAQLELGSSATNYQRVGTAFDVTEVGVRSLSYLSFDGVDDFLVTPTITPGTDKVQVFAGVRKLTDAANTIVESSLTSASNFGTFRLWGVSGGGFGFRSRGPSGTSPGDATVGTPPAPTTQVASGIGDLSTDTSLLRLNGVQVASNTTDQGTGDYSAYAIYIGRRGGTLEPLSGNIYGLIVRFGANLDAGAIYSTETFVNEKTGAY